jgi:hypothetical protein
MIEKQLESFCLQSYEFMGLGLHEFTYEAPVNINDIHPRILDRYGREQMAILISTLRPGDTLKLHYKINLQT